MKGIEITLEQHSLAKKEPIRFRMEKDGRNAGGVFVSADKPGQYIDGYIPADAVLPLLTRLKEIVGTEETNAPKSFRLYE